MRILNLGSTNTDCVRVTETTTGHAVIEVVPSGENAIILYGGANQDVGIADIEQDLSSCVLGDYLLVQNETSAVPEAILKGRERQLRIVFNPAPMSPAVRNYPLECVDVFILNETEAEGLTGKTDPEDVGVAMRRQFPGAATVLTLGSKGAMYFDADAVHYEKALAVKAVDTTAAATRLSVSFWPS